MFSLFKRLRNHFDAIDYATISPEVARLRQESRIETEAALERAEEQKRIRAAQPQIEKPPRIPLDQFVGPIPRRRNSDHVRLDPPLPDRDVPIVMKFTPMNKVQSYMPPADCDPVGCDSNGDCSSCD